MEEEGTDMEQLTAEAIAEYAAKFQPLVGNRLLIRPDEPREKELVSAAGIILPKTTRKRSLCGTVILTGPGLQYPDGTYQPMEVGAGDIVLYNKFTAFDITVDDVNFIILQEDDILAIVDDATASIMQRSGGLY